MKVDKAQMKKRKLEETYCWRIKTKLTEAMVCPECGKTMERGYLTAREGIY